jgi:ribosome-associated protein
MLSITAAVSIPDEEIELNAIRSQGKGGQNVNKVATAIHLRFDIRASSLPERYKEKLLAFSDSRITKEGVIIIKAQTFRTSEQNKEEAQERLKALIKEATATQKKRIATKPTKGSKKRRVDAKKQRGDIKSMRKKPAE